MNKKIRVAKKVIKAIINIKRVDNKLQSIIQNILVSTWFIKMLVTVNMLEYDKINYIKLWSNALIDTIIFIVILYILTKINAIITRVLLQ